MLFSKQKTAYGIRCSDGSSYVCSADLLISLAKARHAGVGDVTPTLPERLIGPAGLHAIVEVALRHVGFPQLALLRVVLLHVRIAAAQVRARRALRAVRQRVMDHVSCVAARAQRLVHALRR